MSIMHTNIENMLLLWLLISYSIKMSSNHEHYIVASCKELANTVALFLVYHVYNE